MNRARITIACAVMSVSLRGVADVATALQAERDAEAKAKSGDFIGAAAKFREAYAADGKPEYLCNVGVAYHKSKKELPRAHLFLKRCQERDTVLDPKFVEAVRSALRTVDAGLRAGNYTPVDITVEPQTASVTLSAFAADEGFVGPRGIWLPYGKHQITFAADGYVSETVDVELSTHTSKSVGITLKHKPIETAPGSGSASGSGDGSAMSGSGSAVEAVGSGSAAVGPGSGSAVVPVHVPAEPKRPSKIPAIASTAVTALAVTVAVLTFAHGHDRADIAQFAVSPDTLRDDKRYIDRQNEYMAASAALGFVGAGISGYLWYRALHAPSTRVEVNASGNGGSVGISGRF